MKVGIDISQIVYEGTGVSVYSEYLVKNLLSSVGSIQLTLFGSSLRKKSSLERFWKSLEGRQNVKKIFLPLPLYLLELLWNSIHLLNIDYFAPNLDIFHTSDWIEPPCRKPKVTTIHDLIALKYPSGIPARIVNNHKRKLQWVEKEERMIIADSNATKNDIIDLLNIREEKIRVIPLAPGEAFKRENLILKAEVVKVKYGINKPFFLSVGTRAPRKNLKKSIAAYKMFKHREEIDYVIVGNFGWGEDIKPIEGLKILNYVSSDELAVLYQEALGFIFPSLYEGFGLPVLEAESMGSPVIASERGSIKEVLSPLSLRINPDSEETITEAMEYLYSIYESQKYFDMVKDGIEFAKDFSWEKTARETLKVYREAAGQ